MKKKRKVKGREIRGNGEARTEIGWEIEGKKTKKNRSRPDKVMIEPGYYIVSHTNICDLFYKSSCNVGLELLMN